MEAMTSPRKPHDQLSDPVQAARAWTRFRWIMRWVAATAILAIAAALFYLKAEGAPLNAVTVIATSAGVGFSVLLAGVLTALMFMSSGTGHDEDVAHFEEDQDPSGPWDRQR
jgi:hypothetical protein